MNYKIAQSIGVNPILMAESNYKDAYYYIFVRFLNKYANEKDQIEGYKKLYKTKLGLNTTRKIPPIISIEKAFEKIKRLTIVNGEIVDFKFILFVDLVNVLAVNDKEFAITILQDYVSYFEQYERNQFYTLFSCMFSEDENLSFKKKIELLYKKLNDDVRKSFFTLIKALVIFLFFYNFTLATVLVCGILYIVRKNSSKKFISNLKTAVKRLNRISYDLKISKMLDSKLINEIKVSDYSDKNIAEYFINTNEAIQHFGLIPILSIWNANNRFFAKKETRVLITANMSAGKSTLINALIGKSIARTSQEVCTGNVCYIYSKPIEDGHIHLDTGFLNMNASAMDLTEFDWSKKIRIASYFRAFNVRVPRVCIIDTPGVNSAINRQHGMIAKNALQSEQYDKLIYVINGNKLGSDEEIKHLKWVADNISKEKILFVLNKLDDFKRVDDDIQISINHVYDDLRKLGFVEPIVYPISAYFGMLIKKKEFGEQLTEDEQDEYEYYKKKFNRPEYDLSRYGNNCSNETEREAIALSKRCGLYSLEEAIYGGR